MTRDRTNDLLKKLELHRSLKESSPGFHLDDDDIDLIVETLRWRGVETKRADDNGETCRQMFRRMEVIREAASAAIRMEWLLPGRGPS
jgi:hypothetical protein